MSKATVNSQNYFFHLPHRILYLSFSVNVAEDPCSIAGCLDGLCVSVSALSQKPIAA